MKKDDDFLDEEELTMREVITKRLRLNTRKIVLTEEQAQEFQILMEKFMQSIKK